jgi:hypothetical protein
MKRVKCLKSATLITAMMVLGSAGPASAGTCGNVTNAKVNGGAAAWNLYCYGGRITISGWVKDTNADGKCAFVKAFGGGKSMPHPKACPKGRSTPFEWTTGGHEIEAYLYTQ